MSDAGIFEAGFSDTVLMIRPVAFGFNAQTAETNACQQAPHDDEAADAINAAAQAEFDGVVRVLRAAGIEVIVINDRPSPRCPDAVFPNNWISFHEDGTVVLYPMFAPNRRQERRRDLLDHLGLQRRVERVLDLSYLEDQGIILEGTGSMVLDRARKVAYACRSPRTTDAGLDAFCAALGYTAARFDARDPQGQPPYHTNVVMALGPGLAVVCLDLVPDPAQRAALTASLLAGGRTILPLSVHQYTCFAGNMLALTDRAGQPHIVLSATAWAALDDAQRMTLRSAGTPQIVEIPTIERIGGGSVRCMLAEVYLPRRTTEQQVKIDSIA